MNSRREFIKGMLAGGLAIGLSAGPLRALAGQKLVKVSILHTNDCHSRIEPFPDNDPKYAGMGGFARRAAMVKKIRRQEKNVLLFDAGDVFQGTPYFNFYQGEAEFRLMSEMGYDAMNIGNHDFDIGLDGLKKQIPNATFSLISSNYDFSDTQLKNDIVPYKIYVKEGIKIGVFGLGIELKGLVSEKLYGNTKYSDPAAKAAEMAHLLKKQKKCDLVVCLSHLGYSYKEDRISDVTLAKQSKNIDLIIGGHTHTFINTPYTFKNSDKEDIIICQVGWGGIKLGRIDFYFSKHPEVKFADAYTIKVQEKII